MGLGLGIRRTVSAGLGSGGMCQGARWTTCVFLGIWTMMAVHCTTVSGQCPTDPIPYIFYVNETDPGGTSILSVPAPGSVTWRYTINDQRFQEYVNFTKNGDAYDLTLAKSLDLEELYEKYNIDQPGFAIVLYCNEPLTGEKEFNIFLTSQAVNEFAPTFNTSSINVYVQETPRNVTVVNLISWASDKDWNPITAEINGFSLLDPPNQMLGILTVNGSVFTRAPLDYEGLPEDKKYLEIGVKVSDTNKSGTASLTIHVVDVDDLPPRFTYLGCPEPCSSVYYRASFNANATGKVSGITPAVIQAEDGDALGASVTYRITGPTDYADYLSMDLNTGEVTVLKPLNGLRATDLVLIFQAQENTPARRSTSTTLFISVQGGAAPIPLASTTANNDDIIIVGVVMGIIVFIILAILIVAMIYYRKRFKKIVHPHNAVKEEQPIDEKGRREENPTPQEQPRPVILSDEEMKVDEEITTWLPANHLSDIVDLSDEDTLKKKKKNGVAPNATKMNSRDSAFEESSDKKSGSEDSHRDHDPDFDPVTEYAEVGMPTRCENDSHVKSSDHVYVPDPTTDHQLGSKDNTHNNINDSGVEEAEYLTPNSTRVKLQSPSAAYSKSNRPSTATDADTSAYSDLISIDDDRTNNIRQNSHSQTGGGISSGAAAHVQNLQGGAVFASSSPKPKSSRRSKKSEHEKLSNSRQSLSDDAEMTEYSTPRSEKSSRGGMSTSTRRFNDEEVLSPHLSTIQDDDDDDDRPEVPPRPKLKQVSGLRIKDAKDDEVHYASVQKKSSRKHKKEPFEKEVESPSGQNKINTEDNNNMSKDENVEKIDPPVRRKRHRKRSRQVKAPEEDIYDGTKDYEDLEMDPEFYLDTNKTRVKRSSRAPAVHVDPDDTQYWITVTNDY